VNTWEYKLSEFTGSADALQALLTQARNEAWELGALLPGQSQRSASQMASPLNPASASSVCMIFKRQIAHLPVATPRAIANFVITSLTTG
jgi:hypothetical protein